MTKDEALKRALQHATFYGAVNFDNFLSSLRDDGWTLAPVEATKAMGKYADLIRAFIQPTGPTMKAGRQAADAIATLTRERDQWEKAAGESFVRAERAEDDRDAAIARAESAERKLAMAKEALSLAESVYRQNCVAPGEPSSVLDSLQHALAELEKAGD